MSAVENSSENLWAKAFTVLAGEGRLKTFYQTPRYEMKGIMKAHGHVACVDMFSLFHFLKKGQKKEAQSFVESIGTYRALAMMMCFNRMVHTWREREGVVSANA